MDNGLKNRLGGAVWRRKYISRKKNGKGAEGLPEAYAELYELERFLVMDAGRYGFVRLQYYKEPQGFSDVITYTDSESMFENLWQEWLDTKLYLNGKGNAADGERIWRRIKKSAGGKTEGTYRQKSRLCNKGRNYIISNTA